MTYEILTIKQMNEWWSDEGCKYIIARKPISYINFYLPSPLRNLADETVIVVLSFPFPHPTMISQKNIAPTFECLYSLFLSLSFKMGKTEDTMTYVWI